MRFVDEIQVAMDISEATAVLHAICVYMERLAQKGDAITGEEREEAADLASFCQKIGPMIRQKAQAITLYRDHLN